jgi:hypothetical protein
MSNKTKATKKAQLPEIALTPEQVNLLKAFGRSFHALITSALPDQQAELLFAADQYLGDLLAEYGWLTTPLAASLCLGTADN